MGLPIHKPYKGYLATKTATAILTTIGIMTAVPLIVANVSLPQPDTTQPKADPAVVQQVLKRDIRGFYPGMPLKDAVNLLQKRNCHAELHLLQCAGTEIASTRADLLLAAKVGINKLAGPLC
jgi:hypothetical protein